MAPSNSSDERYTCPVCGYLSFDERPGSYFICSTCFWEDDTADLIDPFPCAGGPNKVSLLEAQRNYAEFGASELAMLKHVKKPEVPRDPTWRRIDVARDVFDATREFDRHFTAETSPRGRDLYYWRDDYWAKGKIQPLDWHNPNVPPSDTGLRIAFGGQAGPFETADPCPCCGYLTFAYREYPWGKIRDNDICPICFWHEDTWLSHRGADASLFDAFHALGQGRGPVPNNVSLIVAQRNFLVFGASDPRRRQFVRAITGKDSRGPQWRRVDPKIDVFDSKAEFRSELGGNPARLWYWHDEYYLRGRKKPLDW